MWCQKYNIFTLPSHQKQTLKVADKKSISLKVADKKISITKQEVYMVPMFQEVAQRNALYCWDGADSV